MALWQQGQKLYLPPTPVSKVLCSETYVQRKSIFYHAETERLLTIGHPYYPVSIGAKTVPKVSANQYRVFKIQLPDPNQFALPDRTVHNPSKERLVWAVIGVQVSRGQPLGGTVTGHPTFNALLDAENVNRKVTTQTTDDRKQTGLDAKQQQILLLGCTPAEGEYWTTARPCVTDRLENGACPPLELKNKHIEDGDMMEIGFGAANFKEINASKSDLSLDIQNEICLYTDSLKMAEDAVGNRIFFFARKARVYVTHIWPRGGWEKDAPPTDFYLKNNRGDPTLKIPSVHFGSPSGSLVSIDNQFFNRPYCLFRAQGTNNGLAGNNLLFLTGGDNTGGIFLPISVPSEGHPKKVFDRSKFNVSHRHREVYKLAFILEMCSVELTAQSVSYAQGFIPCVFQKGEMGGQPPPSSILEDTYRYIESPATKCASNVIPAKEDPYAGFKFWNIDLKEKLSLDLDQFPLGRRFLAQQGAGCSTVRKRRISQKTSSKPAKKKKK
uniref:Major capsid protein L1 n=1 Tax=Bovine papillomavirus type 1 TaxID=337052 RepID=A0A2H4QT34_BPV1|nr:L1 protein [Bos taurus papillomavirus 1]